MSVLNKANQKSRKLLYGVGINDFNDAIRKNGILLHEYQLWKNMLDRCYYDKIHINERTYKECYVEDYLLSFSNFYNHIHSIKGYELGYQLDKDLLFKNNKVYSRKTICFIPREINMFITKRNKSRGKLPIGVCYNNEKNKYQSTISFNGKTKTLGRFNTPVEAFNVYKEAKEQQAKVLAERWKDKIDERAYNALINYKVEITD